MKAFSWALLVLEIVVLSFFGCTSTLLGQSLGPNVIWQKCLGGTLPEEAFAMQQTSDGGYIVVGFTHSNNGDVSGKHRGGDAWAVKLDKNGKIQWQKCLGGRYLDEAFAVQQTSDGGYIVAGETSSEDGDVSGNHGWSDAWVVKLDKSGNIQWQKCLGGSDYDFAYAVQQSSDGGYIVVGSAKSNNGDVSGNHGNADAWVVKLDKSGEIQWQRCLGGKGEDAARAVQQSSDGGYIVAGYTWSEDGDVSSNHGYDDAWVLKLDKTGNIQWQMCLGGSNSERAYAIQETSDEGYIVAGFTVSSDGDVSGYHGGSDAWIVKLDKNGKIQWQKCLGGSDWEEAYAVQQTLDGGYVMAGHTNSTGGDVSGNHGNDDVWVVKLDKNGNVQWQRCLGGNDKDIARALQQVSDGYIVAGYTKSNDGDVTGNHGDRDVWLVKLGN